VVACGAVLLGCVTGLDWFDDWFDDDWFEEVVRDEALPSSLPSPSAWEPLVVEVEERPLGWLAVAVLPVWVVRPRPTAAPRALTTLSPARPA